MVKKEKARGWGLGSWWAGIKILQFKIALIKLKIKTKACCHALLKCVLGLEVCFKKEKVLLILLFSRSFFESNSNALEADEQSNYNVDTVIYRTNYFKVSLMQV